MQLITTSLNKKDMGKFLGVANGKSPLPVLANLSLEADDNGLTILATNLESAVRQTFSAEVTEKGKALVSAKRFVDIVDRLSNDPIAIKMEGHSLQISQGESIFKLPTPSVDDFPEIRDILGQEFIVDQAMLCQAIKSVVYAASSDNSRFNLNTVLIDGKVIVATDGHRLSKNTVTFTSPTNLLIPSSSCYTLLKSFQGSGNCKVIVSEKWVRVEDDSVALSVRLTDGDYPQWQKVIPQEKGVSLRINKDEMLKSVKRILPLILPHDTGINVNISNNKLEISKTSEIGSATDSIPCEFSGDISFICNAKYLVECLSNIDAQEIILSYIKDGSPVIFSPISNESAIHLVMPMRK